MRITVQLLFEVVKAKTHHIKIIAINTIKIKK